MVSHTMNSFSWELSYIRNNISKHYVVCENQSSRSSHTCGERIPGCSSMLFLPCSAGIGVLCYHTHHALQTLPHVTFSC
jgi:hypothetical protein